MIPEPPLPPEAVTPVLPLRPSLCPAVGCSGTMDVETVMECLEGTGLEAVSCRVCGHRGFRSREGIQTLFGGRHEHVCSYGPSPLTLTIVFSGAALALFRNRGLSPAQAAEYAVQWTLLCGQVAGTVHLILETPALGRCYEHFRRHAQVRGLANRTGCLPS
jgi:hypothetical protein